MQEIDMTTVAPSIKTVLALGIEGAGKTHFVGTFPKPILIYCFDYGYQTLAGTPGVKCKVFIEKNIEQPRAYEEFLAEFKKVQNGQEPLYKWADGREEAYKTIAIDPWSVLSEHVNSRAENKFPNRAGEGTFDRYRFVAKEMLQLRNDMYDVVARFGYFFIATCHIKIDKDEDTGQLWFLADIVGQTRDKAGSWFDAVFFLKAEKTGDGVNAKKTYKLCSLGERRERARLRLPSNIESLIKPEDVPDFSLLLERISKASVPVNNQGGIK